MKANQWLIVVLTAMVAVLGTLVVTGRYSAVQPAYAQEVGSGSSVIGMIGSENSSRVPVFLVDSRAMCMMSYQYDWSNYTLTLTNVRSFRNDRLLIDWSQKILSRPTVDEVGTMVQKQR